MEAHLGAAVLQDGRDPEGETLKPRGVDVEEGDGQTGSYHIILLPAVDHAVPDVVCNVENAARGERRWRRSGRHGLLGQAFRGEP